MKGGNDRMPNDWLTRCFAIAENQKRSALAMECLCGGVVGGEWHSQHCPVNQQGAPEERRLELFYNLSLNFVRTQNSLFDISADNEVLKHEVNFWRSQCLRLLRGQDDEADWWKKS